MDDSRLIQGVLLKNLLDQIELNRRNARNQNLVCFAVYWGSTLYGAAIPRRVICIQSGSHINF